jgi:hypothetical protein
MLNRAIFALADTGPGIPDSDSGEIFEGFTRIDKTRSREPGGTGLGLSVAHGKDRSGWEEQSPWNARRSIVAADCERCGEGADRSKYRRGMKQRGSVASTIEVDHGT